jgi:hypothetical protein
MAQYTIEVKEEGTGKKNQKDKSTGASRAGGVSGGKQGKARQGKQRVRASNPWPVQRKAE